MASDSNEFLSLNKRLFSKEEVIELDIKSLNKKIRDKHLTKEEAKALKLLRRKQKMKEYGVNNRLKEKSLILSLEEKKSELFQQLNLIQGEVEDLRYQKAQLELLSELDKFEGVYSFY